MAEQGEREGALGQRLAVLEEKFALVCRAYSAQADLLVRKQLTIDSLTQQLQ
jgi:hypothetical protein